MGKSPDIDRISDKDQFKETIQAMLILGFDKRQVSFNVINLIYVIVLSPLGLDFRCFKYSSWYSSLGKCKILT